MDFWGLLLNKGMSMLLQYVFLSFYNELAWRVPR